jgi:hypothetical protein
MDETVRGTAAAAAAVVVVVLGYRSSCSVSIIQQLQQ